MEEGLREGIQKARIEDAEKLKALGVSNDIIVKATGISLGMVETL